MKLGVLLKNIAHEVLRDCADEISSVVHDTRKMVQGALFICLRGLTVDGHDFIDAAVEKGAAAVLVDAKFPHEKIPPHVGVVRVENTRSAMAFISANFYGNPAEKLRLIGITGTNGKTTTTYFIEEILRNCGRRTGIIGTVGIRADDRPLDVSFATDTTPDPTELHLIFAKMLSLGVQDVVMEVSSHSLALHKMEGLTFDVGVFTNLTQDHLDFHGTMENYALAKAQLFSQSRFAVVNADDEYTPIMLKSSGDNPFSTYGIKNAANFRAEHVNCTPHGSAFSIDGRAFEIPVSGKFNVYNVLAAIGTAHALGAEMPGICAATARLSGVPGRIQSVPNARGLSVFIDYAHTPDGLENIITAVRGATRGRVITLFGCGGDRDREKRPLMGKIAAKLSDEIFLTSDNPRTENPAEILAQTEAGVTQTATTYRLIENRRDAIFAAIKSLQPDDALIIAGKGHENYQIIGTTKHHFDDYEVATEAMKG